MLQTTYLDTNLTIEQLCEQLNIKGLVHYTENATYIDVRKDNKNYLYNKETGHLIND